MARHFPHDYQVREGCAHVVGGDVAAAEALDDATHRVKQRRCLVAARVSDHHRFAAAKGQFADRRLVGHAAREAQHVGHRVLFAGIRIHAAATERRAERGIVDRDQRPQAARRILCEQQRLMAVVIGVTKHLLLPSAQATRDEIGLAKEESKRMTEASTSSNRFLASNPPAIAVAPSAL